MLGPDDAAAAAAAAACAAADGFGDGFDYRRLCEFGKDRKLPAQRLLLDEVSMMDIPLAAALLDAVK